MPLARITTAARRTSEAAQSFSSLALRGEGQPYAALPPEENAWLQHEMHTYRRVSPRVARVVWAIGGLLGAHRYYLEQIGYGALMTLSAGGALVWWIVDGFHLNRLVAAYNEEQDLREQEGRPPIGMDDVPRVGPEVLQELPAWHTPPLHQGRYRWTMSILLDALALVFFGYLLGAVTSEVELRMPALAAACVALTIHFSHLLLPYRDWPVIRGLLHWDYRLRLFYHFNAPGRRLVLYFRPLLALFYAPFRARERTETRLYLEIGSVFIVFSALIGLFRGQVVEQLISLDFGGFLEGWVKGIVLGFFLTCGFAAPVGAILMKHTLLRRPNYIRWLLSTVFLVFLVLGLVD